MFTASCTTIEVLRGVSKCAESGATSERLTHMSTCTVECDAETSNLKLPVAQRKQFFAPKMECRDGKFYNYTTPFDCPLPGGVRSHQAV
jgi:hypothetical protein